jgi:hypothetical protein
MLYLLCILSSFSSHAEDYDFKPGLWETKISVEILGMPKEMSAMTQPPVLVESECVKQDDVNFMMQGEKAEKNCKITNKRLSAEKVQIKMICVNSDVTTKGHGEMNFKGTVVTGWFDMQMPGPMGQMTMKSVFDSKYIGPCEE